MQAESKTFAEKQTGHVSLQKSKDLKQSLWDSEGRQCPKASDCLSPSVSQPWRLWSARRFGHEPHRRQNHRSLFLLGVRQPAVIRGITCFCNDRARTVTSTHLSCRGLDSGTGQVTLWRVNRKYFSSARLSLQTGYRGLFLLCPDSGSFPSNWQKPKQRRNTARAPQQQDQEAQMWVQVTLFCLLFYLCVQ